MARSMAGAGARARPRAGAGARAMPDSRQGLDGLCEVGLARVRAAKGARAMSRDGAGAGDWARDGKIPLVANLGLGL